MTPGGRLLTAVGDELDGGLEVPVFGDAPVVARLVGWEPCVSTPAGEWVDAGVAAAAGGLGTRLPAGDGALVVYLAGQVERPVRVRPADAAQGLVVTAYRLVDADQRADLRDQLQTDGAPFGAVVMDASHVRRLELTAAGALAVELGEVPTAAYARYDPGVAGPAAIPLCGPVSGEPRFAPGAPLVTTLPVADLQTNGWGWHGPERDARGSFRWSDGVETELLVHLIRIGSIRVEIDASAAAVDLTGESVTVTLVVNDAELPPQVMGRDIQTYAWRVPAMAWKTGMNRVGLRVSAAVSPSVLGLSDDARTLGMSLRRLALTLLE